MYEKNTDELFSELKNDEDIKNFMEQNKNEFLIPPHEYLNNLLEQKKLSKHEVIKASNIERIYAYHIFSGLKKPSRTKLLAISRAMNLDLEETQYLLRYMGHGLLYPRNPWDSIIIVAIGKNLSVNKTNEILEKFGEHQLLG